MNSDNTRAYRVLEVSKMDSNLKIIDFMRCFGVFIGRVCYTEIS